VGRYPQHAYEHPLDASRHDISFRHFQRLFSSNLYRLFVRGDTRPFLDRRPLVAGVSGMRWPPDQSAILALLLLAATALLALQTFRLWARSRVERRRARRARTLGRRGEKDARRLLKKGKYRIEAEQPTARLAYEVDGKAREAVLRPDFLVRQGKRRFVADAKKGADASDIGKRDTRRQLLEYALAFPNVDGVLLVDAERSRIAEVAFPGVHGKAPRRAPIAPFVLGLVCGAGAAVAVVVLLG
jgi:hypothetical protein